MRKNTDPDVVLFAALADPTRLAIVRQLSADGCVCACDFVSCCDVGQPTVSHHLKVLKDAGLVTAERRGSWVWYALASEAVERLQALVGDVRSRPARPLTAGAAPAAAPTAEPLTLS